MTWQKSDTTSLLRLNSGVCSQLSGTDSSKSLVGLRSSATSAVFACLCRAKEAGKNCPFTTFTGTQPFFALNTLETLMEKRQKGRNTDCSGCYFCLKTQRINQNTFKYTISEPHKGSIPSSHVPDTYLPRHLGNTVVQGAAYTLHTVNI